MVKYRNITIFGIYFLEPKYYNYDIYIEPDFIKKTIFIIVSQVFSIL